MKKSTFVPKKNDKKVTYRKPIDSDSDDYSSQSSKKRAVTESPTKANKAVLKKIRKRDNEYQEEYEQRVVDEEKAAKEKEMQENHLEIMKGAMGSASSSAMLTESASK